MGGDQDPSCCYAQSTVTVTDLEEASESRNQDSSFSDDSSDATPTDDRKPPAKYSSSSDPAA